MRYWKTNNSQILTESPPDYPYFKTAYDFGRAWLSGQETFSFKTSGSTGVPKLITVQKAQLQSSARMTSLALELPKGTKALVCLSVEYIAGIMMLVRGLEIGWDLTVIEPSGNPLLDTPPLEKFDFIAMVPLQLVNSLQNDSTRARVDAVGKILLGGAPVAASLFRDVQQLKVPVYQSYGMTETVSHIALRRINGENVTSDYTVLAGVEFGTDSRGCLFVEGAVTDYKRVQTNDLVKITSNRTFEWIGRADSIINSGGVKIQLDKVDRMLEDVLLDLNLSFDFFHWYREDERLGQKLILFVKSTPAEFPSEFVLEELKCRVIPYEVPKAVYFVDSFAKTPTDKLDKRATAAHYYTAKK